MILLPEPGPALLSPAWVPRAASVVGRDEALDGALHVRGASAKFPYGGGLCTRATLSRSFAQLGRN
ncbi:hypothetical protein [Azospirillum doebereinerae]